MPEPLLSIVIPTHGRPQFLATAIDSAMTGMGSELELIVVPNGPDQSWQGVLDTYAHDPRVRVAPIDKAHGGAARNHGMALARGRYLRFLDDDDVLYPEGARQQLDLMQRCNADVVSAPIDFLRGDGTRFGGAKQIHAKDFIASVMQAGRLQHMAHLFQRQSVKDVRWDESLPFGQDVDWLLQVCGQLEPVWQQSAQTCGGWRRHTGPRTSIGAGLHRAKQMSAEGILRLVRKLESGNRLTQERRVAAASGLWDCVHSALFMAPRYWATVAAEAERLLPGSRPDTAFFRYPLVRRIGLSPLQWEMVLAPKRMLTYTAKRALLELGLARRW